MILWVNQVWQDSLMRAIELLGTRVAPIVRTELTSGTQAAGFVSELISCRDRAV
jgi:hypothetical protein